MQTLYPAIKPYLSHELAVTPPHVLYVEEVGNPKGIPVIILHPGPGAGGDLSLRRYFDPEYYRMIIFDQRGAGRSTPHAEIKKNTTDDLIQDIHAIRDYLGLSRFILFGGGWGSLLAMLYAQKYPMHVSGLLLQRIFLGRQTDIDWFYHQGANLIYPDYWEQFIAQVPLDKIDAIPEFYAHQLQSDNEIARMSAAKSWGAWQAHAASIQPHQNVLDQFSDPHFALSLATIESYYIVHNFFIKENQVILDAAKIKHIPTYLIHGRYDMVSPFANAWDLYQALPHAQLRIIREAGHSEREAGMIDALISASKELVHHDLDVS